MASISALIRKEFRLQRTNLFFAAAVGLVWLLMLWFAWSPNHPLGVQYFTSGDLAQWVHILFVLPCLYGLIPMMAGASAIAEERRLDILDWQLAQPSRRWKQWLVKAAVAVVIALASGAFATLADAILFAILHAHDAHSTWTTGIIGPSMVWLRGLWPGEYSLLAVALGAFASSLLRDAYRALLLALALAFGVHWVSTWIDPGSLTSALWGGLYPAQFFHPAIHYIMTAALAGIILALAGYGFRLDRIRLRGQSIEIACLALGILATTWVTLHVEYRIRYTRFPIPEATAAPPHKNVEKSLRVLFVQKAPPSSQTPWRPGDIRLFRLPGTDRILVDMELYDDFARTAPQGKTDIQQLRRGLGKVHSTFASVSQGGIPHRIFEVDAQSGEVTQNPNLMGTLFSVSTEKPCYSVWTTFSRNLAVCGDSWPRVRSDFQIDPKQCANSPNRFPGEVPLVNFARVATPPGWKKGDILLNPAPDALYPFGGKSDLWLYRQIGSKKWGQVGVRIEALVRPVAGSPNNYRIIDSGDGPVQYSVSSDGKWFLRNPGLVKGPGKVIVKEIDGPRMYFLQNTYGWMGQVFLSDHPTTGGTQIVYFPGPALAFQYLRRPQIYHQRRVETGLDTDGEILPISPDGRYLALPRFHVTPDNTKTQLTVSVLDLETGKETLLASTEEPGPVRFWFMQHLDTSVPICRWSKGGILGTLMTDRLYLFKSPPRGGAPAEIGTLQLHPIANAPPPGNGAPVEVGSRNRFVGSPRDFAFWSDTVMLLWNGEAIWRLDLNKAAIQPTTAQPRPVRNQAVSLMASPKSKPAP